MIILIEVNIQLFARDASIYSYNWLPRYPPNIVVYFAKQLAKHMKKSALYLVQQRLHEKNVNRDWRHDMYEYISQI